jgi:hypothetical protein
MTTPPNARSFTPMKPDQARLQQIASQSLSLFTGNVCLLVGKTHFNTTRNTLCAKSSYFRRFFAEADADPRRVVHRWRAAHPGNTTEVYFLDEDPALFVHVLRYLRHGCRPLPPSGNERSARSSDGVLRTALLGLAVELEIGPLVHWLTEGPYKEAVRMGSLLWSESDE